MEEINQAILGTGWGFPPEFSLESKGIRLVRAEEDIKESLHILLSTNLGERVMQPNYGCNLNDLIFENLSPSVISAIKEVIRVSILYNEPRIRLENLDIVLVEPNRGLVKIILDYIIISSNTRFNFVFPFYLQESV